MSILVWSFIAVMLVMWYHEHQAEEDAEELLSRSVPAFRWRFQTNGALSDLPSTAWLENRVRDDQMLDLEVRKLQAGRLMFRERLPLSRRRHYLPLMFGILELAPGGREILVTGRIGRSWAYPFLGIAVVTWALESALWALGAVAAIFLVNYLIQVSRFVEIGSRAGE